VKETRRGVREERREESDERRYDFRSKRVLKCNMTYPKWKTLFSIKYI